MITEFRAANKLSEFQEKALRAGIGLPPDNRGAAVMG
jgi:hypothetical protein